MEVLSEPPATHDPAPAGSTAGGKPFSGVGCCCPGNVTGIAASADSAGSGTCDYKGMWSYRRAFAVSADRPYSEVNTGDVSQQNWGNPSGNDLDNAYLFLPLEQARSYSTFDASCLSFTINSCRGKGCCVAHQVHAFPLCTTHPHTHTRTHTRAHTYAHTHACARAQQHTMRHNDMLNSALCTTMDSFNVQQINPAGT